MRGVNKLSLVLKAQLLVLLLIIAPTSGKSQIDSIKTLKASGSHHYFAGNYDQSSYCFEKISKLYEAQGDSEASLDYLNKSIKSLKQYDIKLALHASSRLKEKLENICALQEISFELWYAVSDNIASIRLLNGQYDKAICILRQISDTIFYTKGLTLYRSQFLNSQFDICTANEKSGSHLKSIQIIVDIEQYIKTKQDTIKFYDKLADLNNAIGNYEQSNQYLFRLLKLYEGDSFDYAINLNLIGNNYSKFGNPGLAIQFYLKSLDIRKVLFNNDDPKLGVVYHNLGNMYKSLDKNEEAYRHYKKALDNYLLAFGEPSEQVGFVYNSLGNYFFNKLEFEQALRYYKKGLINRKKVLRSNHRFILHSYYNIANSFLQIGLLDSAKIYVKSAIFNNPISQKENILSANFDNIDYLKDYAYSYWLDGEIHYYAYQHDNNIHNIRSSSNSYNESAQSYYKLLKFQNHETSKFAFVEDLRSSIIGALNGQIIIDSINGGQNFLAIYDLFEKSHNSQLFELLRNATLNTRSTTNKKDVFERIEYMRRVEAIKKSDTSNYRNNTQELSNLYDKLTAYKSKRNIHQNNFYKSETSYIDLESFKSQLDEKTLILQFLVSPKTDQVFFFTISKNWQKYGSVSSYETFRSLSENFSSAVNKLELSIANGYSIRLSNLIKKAIPKDFNNFERIVIIPDEFIWKIPFDALTNPFEANKYLIEDFDITIHLSCNLLSFYKGENSSSFAYDFIGFAPSFANTMISNFQNIPSAKMEVVNAAKTFSSQGLNSFCMLDNKANLESFITLSPEGRVLHFATHFNYDSKAPNNGLLLYPQSDKRPEIIGYEEVLLSGASPELVVLSACKSVYGTADIIGEGPINLNRAFIMNGSRAIIYSINKIDDNFSKEFFHIFYQNLGLDMNYMKCLQTTKKVLLDDPKYSNPFFWSSFQIISTL